MILKDFIKELCIISMTVNLRTDVTGICCDSANIRPGEIFVAIEGFKTDGHIYIKDAQSKGAACVVCQDESEAEKCGLPYIKVKDTRQAMAALSCIWFNNPAEKLKLTGVTGTNGKTTVTYMIKHIIEQCSGSKTGLVGTIANLIGSRELDTALTTPDAYRLQHIFSKMVFEGCKYAVMEVSSHALSLKRVYGIKFDIGIFTNLTPEHLDFHISMDDYAAAKGLLFKNSKDTVINIDDEYAKHMSAYINTGSGRHLTYSTNNSSAGLYATDIDLRPDKVLFTLIDNVNNIQKPVTVNIPGLFTVYNALAAMGAGILLNFKTDDIIKAIKTCEGIKGRAEVIKTADKDYTVLVDYAHTPDALANIIKTIREASKGKVHTLFGCGGDRDKSKRPVMGMIASELSDYVIITSDNPRTEDPEEIINDILTGIPDLTGLMKNGKIKVIANRKDAIFAALDNMSEKDALIIAGKGHETYQIIGTEKTHFDDREVVDEYFIQARENKRRNHINIEGLD